MHRSVTGGEVEGFHSAVDTQNFKLCFLVVWFKLVWMPYLPAEVPSVLDFIFICKTHEWSFLKFFIHISLQLCLVWNTGLLSWAVYLWGSRMKRAKSSSNKCFPHPHPRPGAEDPGKAGYVLQRRQGVLLKVGVLQSLLWCDSLGRIHGKEFLKLQQQEIGSTWKGCLQVSFDFCIEVYQD